MRVSGSVSANSPSSLSATSTSSPPSGAGVETLTVNDAVCPLRDGRAARLDRYRRQIRGYDRRRPHDRRHGISERRGKVEVRQVSVPVRGEGVLRGGYPYRDASLAFTALGFAVFRHGVRSQGREREKDFRLPFRNRHASADDTGIRWNVTNEIARLLIKCIAYFQSPPWGGNVQRDGELHRVARTDELVVMARKPRYVPRECRRVSCKRNRLRPVNRPPPGPGHRPLPYNPPAERRACTGSGRPHRSRVRHRSC